MSSVHIRRACRHYLLLSLVRSFWSDDDVVSLKCASSSSLLRFNRSHVTLMAIPGLTAEHRSAKRLRPMSDDPSKCWLIPPQALIRHPLIVRIAERYPFKARHSDNKNKIWMKSISNWLLKWLRVYLRGNLPLESFRWVRCAREVNRRFPKYRININKNDINN